MVDTLTTDNFAEPPYIVDGMPVNAANTNPSIIQLYQNDLALRNILEYFQMPSALLAKVEVNPAVQVGQPVYYSSETGRYELASFAKTTVGGQVYLAATAEVWGIVTTKLSNDTVYMLVDGIHPVDLTSSAGAGPHAGRYYLGDTPGELTTNPTDLTSAVFVCATAENGKVLFRPHTNSLGGLLAVWRHVLSGQAAGDPLVVDGHVTVTNQDADSQGWLMANNAAFGGNAPVGAVFGYNIAADETLTSLWPPLFLQTVHLELFRDSSSSVGGTSVPLGVGGLCIVDENGIWWMSSCVDDSPFVVAPPPHIDPEDCPRVTPRQVVFHAMKPTSVSSMGGMALRSTHPSVRVYRSGTSSVAQQGELDLSLSPVHLLDAVDGSGAFAVTTADSGSLIRTPVVRSITAGPGVTVTADNLLPGSWHGNVTISAVGQLPQVILPATTSLVRAAENQQLGTLGILLPQRRISQIVSAFHLPAGTGYTYTVEYCYWAMASFSDAEEGTADPELHDLNIRMLSSPVELGSPLSAMTLLSVPLEAMPQVHQRVFEVKSDPMLIAPGTTLFASLSRQATNLPHGVVVLKHFMKITGIQTST